MNGQTISLPKILASEEKATTKIWWKGSDRWTGHTQPSTTALKAVIAVVENSCGGSPIPQCDARGREGVKMDIGSGLGNKLFAWLTVEEVVCSYQTPLSGSVWFRFTSPSIIVYIQVSRSHCLHVFDALELSGWLGLKHQLTN